MAIYIDSARVRGFLVNAYRDGFRGRLDRFSTSTADLDRVEVLKGPASVLYGRLEPGGFINQVSKQPLATPYYSLQQQLGSFDLYRTTLGATGPITTDDTLLYSVNFEYLNSGSFREFVEAESVFASPVLTWNLSDRTRISLNLRYFDGESSYDRGLIALGDGVAPIPISRNLGEPWAVSEWQDFEAGVTFSHDFTKDWNLRLRLATEQFDAHFLGVDFDGLLPDNRTLLRSAFEDLEETAIYSTELNLTGYFQTWRIRHTVLLGADYYNEDFNPRFSFPSLDPIDIFNPVHGAPRPSASFTFVMASPLRRTALACRTSGRTSACTPSQRVTWSHSHTSASILGRCCDLSSLEGSSSSSRQCMSRAIYQRSCASSEEILLSRWVRKKLPRTHCCSSELMPLR